jgi:hypothetical protein
MEDRVKLQEQIERCRRLASQTNDVFVKDGLLELATTLEERVERATALLIELPKQT